MWPALFSVLYTTAAPLRVVKSGLVQCVLSLVRCDSLYFSSLHFSSLSLRVVSHQQRSLSLRRVQCYTQVLTIKANFHPKPLQSPLARMLLFLARSLFFFYSLFHSAVLPPVKSVENVRLLLSRWFQSAGQSSGIMFDTVRWPGKLKTQLKWQSRGQLLCISKALLWLFYTNYIR